MLLMKILNESNEEFLSGASLIRKVTLEICLCIEIWCCGGGLEENKARTE